MSDRFRLLVAQVARLAMVIALVFVFVPLAQSGPAQPQNGTNLLTNGGFEAFTDGVANGWTKWWSLSGEHMDEPTYRRAEGVDNVHGDTSSQRVGSREWRKHNGGLYQQISGLTVGHAASFSVWHKWPGDPKNDNQAVQLWIGIDPQGGIDAASGSVVWSDSMYATDAWQQMHLATTALSTTATVFLRSTTLYPYQPYTPLVEGYVLWDDAILTSGPWQKVYLPLVARNYVPPCSLQNGGFEGTYALYDPEHYSNKLVAPHWTPIWEHVEGSLADPEYNYAVSPDPVHRGELSQQYGTFRRFYKAGLYQQLTGCTVSSTLQFSAWGWGYANDKEQSTSDPTGDMRMRVGIDPTGGTVFTSTNVIWSWPAVNPLDTWMQMGVTATVAAPTVTVFVLSEPAQAWLHNTSYWDDASLERLP